MTCGACLSLLQWSVDSAALIGYHVVNDVRCLPVTVTVERGHAAALIGYHVGQ